MELPLSRQPGDCPWPCRAARLDDKEALALLLYAAFRGTVDDEDNSHEDAETEISKVFAGEYGRLMPEASFVIEDGEFLTSACLISWYEPAGSPFVVFTMTRPEHKNRGMARALLRKSIQALYAAGYEKLTLIVTRGNHPAEHLYTSMGFREIDPS
jgi:ribosomal protein S18 acetylase RimI-like enzyme